MANSGIIINKTQSWANQNRTIYTITVSLPKELWDLTKTHDKILISLTPLEEKSETDS